MAEYTLSINCPPTIRKVRWGLLSQNVRCHWTVRREVTRWWRQAAATTATQAQLPKLGKVHVTVTFHKNTNRRYDVANLYPVVKACLDGVTDVLLVDDSNEYVVGPDMRAGEKSTTPHVVIRIRELTEDQS